MSGFLPTLEQSLLLQVALAPDARALAAWTAWREVRGAQGLTHIDPASSHLLPLIARRLETLPGYDRWELAKIKGVHKKSLTRNMLLQHRVRPLLARFADAGIDAVVVGAAGLVKRVYPDLGARYMVAFDVWIPPATLPGALSLAREAGWTPTIRAPERRVEVGDFQVLRGADGLELVLRTHFLAESFCAGNADTVVRDRTLEEARGAETRVLAPEDALVQAAVVGASWSAEAFVDWATDLALGLARWSIDWDRVVELAATYKVGLAVGSTLGTLPSVGVPVPVEVLRTLVKLPKSGAERAAFAARTTRPPLELASLWADYRFRFASGKSLPRALIGFKRFYDLRLGHI